MSSASGRPLVVAALGGNALLRRGDRLDAATQRARAGAAAASLARLTQHVDLVVTHGNGPQVGLLAAEQRDPPWPLDVLVAETQGMIGYVLADELDAALHDRRTHVILTRVLVDAADVAFATATKPIGSVYASQEELIEAAAGAAWTSARDGDGWRRTVASPAPLGVVEIDAIRAAVERGEIPICCGGGGIPVASTGGRLEGVEAVVDKDAASAVLAAELGADVLLLLTDVDGVHDQWGGPGDRLLPELDPVTASHRALGAGTMAPKVRAAADFALRGGTSRIGSLDDAVALWRGTTGTTLRPSLTRAGG